MTIKSFNFENPKDLDRQERNWRQLDLSSTFKTFTPTVTDITNPGNIFGYVQLYGPTAYYYIKMEAPGAGFITAGAAPRIEGLPYGVETPSGSKTSTNDQWFPALNSTGVELVTGQYARFRSLAGVTQILLPVWVGNISGFHTFGWIFRDA